MEFYQLIFFKFETLKYIRYGGCQQSGRFVRRELPDKVFEKGNPPQADSFFCL